MSSRAGIHAPRYSSLVLEDGLARERNPVTCEGAVARLKFNRGEQSEFLDEGAARSGMEFGQLIEKRLRKRRICFFHEKGTCGFGEIFFRSCKLFKKKRSLPVL